jgi:ubiquinone/menaquinone biosynthesis C-methylase UbiE
LVRECNVKRFIKVLSGYFNSIKNLFVLDVGCAQGRDVNELSMLRLFASGVDVNEDFIVEAKGKYPNLNFDVGEAESLSYSDDFFNAICCLNTLFWTNLEKNLPKIERVLKKGGIAFLAIDERVDDLDKKEIIYSSDLDKVLRYLNCSEVLEKKYLERVDSESFRHKHCMYEVVFRKK